MYFDQIPGLALDILDPFALGHIDRDSDDADQRAILVAERRVDHIRREGRAVAPSHRELTRPALTATQARDDLSSFRLGARVRKKFENIAALRFIRRPAVKHLRET